MTSGSKKQAAEGELQQDPRADPERVSTGNSVTDQILGGGFLSNTINIVMGQPGTGKTIFVEQLLFANAGGERPVLYLTTLSEPLAKVVRFVQGFAFYDEEKLGTAVIYEDIGRELSREGISVLLPRLREAIKTLSPSMIVIDSFRALHDLTDSALELRRLVHDLTGLLTAYETTAFLIGEYHEADIRIRPEFAVADGVVELSRNSLSTRDERSLRVLKLRGSRYLEGAHAFQITGHGLDVHPRLVTPRLPVEYEPASGRVSIGVPELDEMIDGGLPAGSATVLTGPSGAGKTTLALQFALEGVRNGEPSLFVNFQENPNQLARTIVHLADEDTASRLEILYASPVELQIDSIVVAMFRRIQAKGIRRVVIDAIGDLAAAASERERLHDYLYALIQRLAVSGITSIFTFENPSQSVTGEELNAGPISYMADNIICLGMSGDQMMKRSIRVLKARGSAHDHTVRSMAIHADGIHVNHGSP